MEDLNKCLLKSLQDLKQYTPMVHDEETKLAFNPEVFSDSASVRNEFAAFYKIRLSTLKPFIKQSAINKWGASSLTYHSTLLALRADVLIPD